MKAAELEFKEKPGATVWGCCVGEDSGELLASDERSEALEMDTSCWEQNGSDSATILRKRRGERAADWQWCQCRSLRHYLHQSQ